MLSLRGFTFLSSPDSLEKALTFFKERGQPSAPRIFLTHEISVSAEIPKATKGGEHARP